MPKLYSRIASAVCAHCIVGVREKESAREKQLGRVFVLVHGHSCSSQCCACIRICGNRLKGRTREFMHLWCRRRLCICCSVCCIALQCALQCAFHQISCIRTVAADCVFVAVCVAVCVAWCCSVCCNVRFIRVCASAVSPQTVYVLPCMLQCVLHRVAVYVATCASLEFVHLQCRCRKYICHSVRCSVCCSVCAFCVSWEFMYLRLSRSLCICGKYKIFKYTNTCVYELSFIHVFVLERNF